MAFNRNTLLLFILIPLVYGLAAIAFTLNIPAVISQIIFGIFWL